MKTIFDPRLPHTTELPDECALEAVVARKAIFLDPTFYGGPYDDATAEARAVAQEQANARSNAESGLTYRENNPPVSSTIGCPVPPPETPTPPVGDSGPSNAQSAEAPVPQS